MKEKKRVYHHYKLWEDYRAGFYNNCSGSEKELKIKKVLEMFQSKDLTKEYMNRVINEWNYSCEQNFTNSSINKIAYLGQAACCIYAEVPNTVTMEAWSLLDRTDQDTANKIAVETIEKWKEENKNIQLCLSLD